MHEGLWRATARKPVSGNESGTVRTEHKQKVKRELFNCSLGVSEGDPCSDSTAASHQGWHGGRQRALLEQE